MVDNCNKRNWIRNRPSFWIQDDTIGMLYRVEPKKSGVMHLFWNSWLQRGEQMNEILE